MTDLFKIPKSFVARHYDECEELPRYRTEFMRDRDRIMYATAFRRLAGKTQIFTVGRDDHKRNRLTHTLEVSQIARTIATALSLDVDLTETIALGHDFGHTPFGHAGEMMLNEIMIPNSPYIKDSPLYKKSETAIKKRFAREKREYKNDLYGFKHNLQSTRVVASLEDSYRDEFGNNVGLNLTNFSIYGVMIHSKIQYPESESPLNFQNAFNDRMKLKGKNEFAWSLEAYVVKWADEIAQWHHDLEDAIRSFSVPADIINNTIVTALGDAMDDEAKDYINEICKRNVKDREVIAKLSHAVINTLVNDIVDTSLHNMNKIRDDALNNNVNDAEQFFCDYDNLKFLIPKEQIISFSPNVKKEVFEDNIRNFVHYSRNVERMNEKGKYIIRKLFEAYFAHPQQLPDGPILHLLVESGCNKKKYPNIDSAKRVVIGDARKDLDEIIKNPDVFTQMLLMRRICDHIACMTDRYAIEEYNNLYG